MSSHAGRLGLDQKRPEQHDGGKRARDLQGSERAKSRRGAGGARWPGPGDFAAAGIDLDVDEDQEGQESPEEGIRNREAPTPPQPVGLVSMKEPGGQKDRSGSPDRVPAGCGHRLSRNTTGLKKIRTMKSFQ